jgi:hypothetical protein
MGRTACTEPQCMYKGALYFYIYFTHSNDLSVMYSNIILSLTYVQITHKIAANEIFQQKFCKNCFFHFLTSFTGWKVMSGKRCHLYRGERSELNGAQYTVGRDYGSITSQYTLGPDYGISQVRWLRKSEGDGESFLSRKFVLRIVTFSWFKWRL